MLGMIILFNNQVPIIFFVWGGESVTKTGTEVLGFVSFANLENMILS